MDLRSLRHVVVLARRLSYTKAAEELGLTQSALSRSIQAVERRAGVRLFDRDRGGVRPTAVGRAYAERAAALLREADELDGLLQRSARGVAGEIAFGIAPMLAAALLPETLAEGLAATPDLRSRVMVRDAAALFSLLMSERIEFAVCSEGLVPAEAPIKATPLGRFPRTLLVRAGHPLLAAGPGGQEQAYPLIVTAPFERRGAELQRMGPPQIVLEDHGVLMRIAETSDAVWLSSAFAAAEEILQGRLKALPWPQAGGQRMFRVAMYSLDRRTLSPAALRLRDQFRARVRLLTAAFAPAGEKAASTA